MKFLANFSNFLYKFAKKIDFSSIFDNFFSIFWFIYLPDLPIPINENVFKMDVLSGFYCIVKWDSFLIKRRIQFFPTEKK